MRRNRTTVVGIVCGLACAACVFAYVQGVRTEADADRAEALARYGGEQLEVCVAKRDIAAGETVDAGAVETRLWVADLLPDEAICSMEDAVGRRASSTVLAGEVLSDRRFRETDAHLDVPAGMTAVSVPAQDVRAVGGAVMAGSRVDVYATGGSSTDAIASDVLVLATNASSKDDASDAEVAWVTLAVAPESVQEMIAAAQKTELYFSLPSDEQDAGGAEGDGGVAGDNASDAGGAGGGVSDTDSAADAGGTGDGWSKGGGAV